MGEHIEAIQLGHDDIEQHDRDFFTMLLQLLHSFKSIRGLDNLVFVTEHLTQNHAVHLGVVDDKQNRLVKLARLKGIDISDHATPFVFRAVHKAIGLLHGGFDSFAVRNNAADARREELTVVIGQWRLRHGIADSVEASREGFLIDIRHHEQEFIATETHKHIGIAHTSLHRFRGGVQRQIARMVTQGIVHKLEVVQIDNGNARENALTTQLIFIKATIECAR